MFVESLAEWEKAALKVAAGTLVKRLGGHEAARLVAGRSPERLNAYQDLHKPDFMPLDVVLRMERAYVEMGGEPIITLLLARQHGLLVVPVPKGEGELGREMARMLREAAEAAARHLEAMQDGRLSEAERAALAEAVQRVHTISAHLCSLLAAPRAPLRAVPAA